MEQTLIPGDAGGAMAPPYFGRSVNHISTEGGRLCPTNNTGTSGFLDLPTALTHWWSFEKIFTWKLVIKFLFYLIFRPLMRLLLSWTPLTRIATRTRRWSCNFCVTIWLFGHLMLQPTTQTLEMPLLLLSKKNNKKKNSSNHGKQARSDWPSLVASSNFSSFSKTLKAEPRCPPPYLFTLFCRHTKNIIICIH